MKIPLIKFIAGMSIRSKVIAGVVSVAVAGTAATAGIVASVPQQGGSEVQGRSALALTQANVSAGSTDSIDSIASSIVSSSSAPSSSTSSGPTSSSSTDATGSGTSSASSGTSSKDSSSMPVSSSSQASTPSSSSPNGTKVYNVNGKISANGATITFTKCTISADGIVLQADFASEKRFVFSKSGMSIKTSDGTNIPFEMTSSVNPSAEGQYPTRDWLHANYSGASSLTKIYFTSDFTNYSDPTVPANPQTVEIDLQ